MSALLFGYVEIEKKYYTELEIIDKQEEIVILFIP